MAPTMRAVLEHPYQHDSSSEQHASPLTRGTPHGRWKVVERSLGDLFRHDEAKFRESQGAYIYAGEAVAGGGRCSGGDRARAWLLLPSSLAVLSIQSMTSAGRATSSVTPTGTSRASVTPTRPSRSLSQARRRCASLQKIPCPIRPERLRRTRQAGPAQNHNTPPRTLLSLFLHTLSSASTASHTTTDAAHSSWRRSGERRTHSAPRSARRSPARLRTPAMNSTRATNDSPSPSSTRARIPRRSPSSSSPAA